MSTLKQIEANRRNSLRSSGPRTPIGRAASSQNAFQTGMYAQALIVPGEKSEDFEALAAEYYDRHQPQSPEERDFLDIAIRNVWRLRRFDRVESEMWERELAELGSAEASGPLGAAFQAADQRFARLQRMIAATERSLREALRELNRLQAARPEPPKKDVVWELAYVDPVTGKEISTFRADPKPQPIETAATSSSIGFVSSTAQPRRYPVSDSTAIPIPSPQSPVPNIGFISPTLPPYHSHAPDSRPPAPK
jgi:hypothetical protein